ncbi:exopolyphosphatase [Mucilaginibacter hurinus]|uniref:Exopolyphosphatase n=1 Tax=Mucilaginibacter hurinus TaxID=2201324 RepID=A0A367GRT4_9SPHI|nr:exopolyphosphatase [Mucilaginibacter hurinus]RCH56162.1 exopolyphosphatase [Mucilaginibacter hurinus]
MTNIITPPHKRVAVMDLGTNTFHLLIAEGGQASYKSLVHQHIGVKLGEGGINKGLIQPDAYKRGMDTMHDFHRQIVAQDVTAVRAIATSAMRNAGNGKDFIRDVEQSTGIKIEVINGDSEAEFIYKGIKAAGCLTLSNSLILDIGGGSVEFIVGNIDSIFYKHSFEIGAARLMDKFHQTDPIPADAVNELNKHLETHLTELFNSISDLRIEQLIGSSGTFETLAEVIELDKGHPFDIEKTQKYNFNYDDLVAVTDRLVNSTHAQRAGHEGIIPIRVDMIVVASLITRFVMDKLGIKNVVMSTSSLKEGVLADMLNQR